jgi:VIT1/CCC1 family predicted Fe2+/Mn2+ transporter
MNNEMILLFMSTGGIALLHTLLGPDHFLPFVALGKVRNWSIKKLSAVTLAFGFAHTLGTVLLGFIGIRIGASVKSLMHIENLRGDFDAWALVVLGFTYMVWGLKRAYKNKTHSHWHVHADGLAHTHDHNHPTEHAHVHAEKTASKGQFSYLPWALFVIFIFGPCEPLIPLLMVSADKFGMAITASLILTFTLITLGTMLIMVLLLTKGLDFIPAKPWHRFSHMLSGGTIGLCGAGMLAFGI